MLLAAFIGLFASGYDAQSSESLPQVLVIGDSISIGYTSHVTQMLNAEATVMHNKGIARDTKHGLKNLDTWIGTAKWDVIYFNWGLWDICYRNPDANIEFNWDKVNGPVPKKEFTPDKVKGTITTSLSQYEKNLEQLVLRLKKTNAVLVWANTTVVPEGDAGRFAGDEKKFNVAAARVMKRHGIMIDDLHTLTEGFAPEYFLGPGDVHYNENGYKKLAYHVTEKIRAALKGGYSAGSVNPKATPR